MNPRDEESLAHRILRRGIPYGPPFEPGVEGRGADKERGLLFNAFVTSIKDQFEALLQAANDPAPQGPDALLGRPRSNDPFQVPLVGVEKPRKFSLEDFVQVKGVIYAFAPSIPVLRALAENRLDELGLDGS
jgi:deferrochelatase/peroxidase EfeB